MASETFSLPGGGTVTGNSEVGIRAARGMRDHAEQMAREEAEWVAALRHIGVKAAHPDDGWVNRETNEVYLCYPQFNDGLQAGDRLALGHGWSGEKQRIVTVIGKRALILDPSMIYWKFQWPPAAAPREGAADG